MPKRRFNFSYISLNVNITYRIVISIIPNYLAFCFKRFKHKQAIIYCKLTLCIDRMVYKKHCSRVVIAFRSVPSYATRCLDTVQHTVFKLKAKTKQKKITVIPQYSSK